MGWRDDIMSPSNAPDLFFYFTFSLVCMFSSVSQKLVGILQKAKENGLVDWDRIKDMLDA